MSFLPKSITTDAYADVILEERWHTWFLARIQGKQNLFATSFPVSSWASQSLDLSGTFISDSELGSLHWDGENDVSVKSQLMAISKPPSPTIALPVTLQVFSKSQDYQTQQWASWQLSWILGGWFSMWTISWWRQWKALDKMSQGRPMPFNIYLLKPTRWKALC